MTDFALARDVIVSLAAIVTAGVAVFGLNTWKKKESLSAARNLLLATYKLKDAFAKCRSSLIIPSEFPEGYRLSSHSPEDEANAFAHLYRNRMKLVSDARSELDASVLEAKILCDDEVEEKIGLLHTCEVYVFAAQLQVVKNKQLRGELFEKDPELGKRMKEIVGCHEYLSDVSHNRKKDAFAEKVSSIVADIEKIARQHFK